MNPFELLRKALMGPKRYKWEKEYASGRWDYLNEPLEEDRYNAVLAFVKKYLEGNKAILEIGCGEGILQERMPKNSYKRFLGIDISRVAISKAARLKDEITDYLAGDMEKYVPPGKYAMIIFNEVLYYSPDPIHLVNRYLPYLEPGGRILSSLTETPKSLAIMNDLEKEFTVLDQKVSQNKRGAWHCKLYSKDPA